MTQSYEVWTDARLTRTFIEDVRGGVPCAAEQLGVMLRILSAGPRPITSFLDLGCGGGALARTVLGGFPDARATLLDLSPPMLEVAREALATHRPPPRILEADLGDPSWVEILGTERRFDAVVSGYAIHHLPHERKRSLYAEIVDLLEPGGFFVNIEHVASATPWLEVISDELMVDTIHAYQRNKGTSRSRDDVMREFVARPDKAANILAPVEAQCDWLREAGLVEVDCYFKIFELAVFGGRRP